MNLRRAAANAAILTALSIVLMLVMWMLVIPSTGLTQDDMMNPIKIGQFALGHKAMWSVACLSDLISGLTLPFLTLALYRKFRKNQPGRAAAIGIFGVMSSIAFFVAGCISELAPSFVQKLPNAAELFAALGAIQQPIEMAGFFLISVATWHTVRAAHKTNAFNAVTLYAGYFASLGVLVIPLAMISAEAAMIGMIPMIGAIVYNFGLGMNLMNAGKNQELETATA